MGGEQRKRFDNIRMGKMALDDMSKVLSRGISTFSLIGDNDYTVAASQWEEAIGRMQSGGGHKTKKRPQDFEKWFQLLSMADKYKYKKSQ